MVECLNWFPPKKKHLNFFALQSLDRQGAMFPRDLTVWKLTLSILVPITGSSATAIQNPAFWTMLCWLVQSPRFSGQFPGVLRRTNHSNVENTTNWLSKPYLTNWFFQGRMVYHVLFFTDVACNSPIESDEFRASHVSSSQTFPAQSKTPQMTRSEH